jgi:hypothetical protein
MALTHQDAAEALRLAEAAEARSDMLRGYQSTASHLILWGAVYAVAYALSYFRPAQAGWGWVVLIALGSLGSTVIGARDRPDRQSGRAALIIPTLMATFFVFIVATSAIMQPQDPRQMGAFVPLVVAVCYVVLGLGAGSRITLAGVALGALTLVGYFAFPSIFMLWMAVVAGGTLVLSGLWLRRV